MSKARRYTKQDYRKMIEGYQSDTTAEQLAKELNREPKAIADQIRMLQRQGLIEKRQSKTTILEELKTK